MRSKKDNAKKANEVKKTVEQDYLKHNQSPPYKVDVWFLTDNLNTLLRKLALHRK